MALTNYERQKKWREKNRALYNLQRRNRRKDLGGGAEESELQENPQLETASLSPKSTIEALRELVKVEQERVVEAPVFAPAKFGTYRDDGGRPITERAWNELQELKKKAKEKEYHVDEYIQ